MARPRKEIDKKQFENLCALQCTLKEIAGFFECSEDTIERWCKRTYKTSFADAFNCKSQGGKIALRREQFALAKKSATMAIWLGRNYLDQREETVVAASKESLNAFNSLIAAIGGDDEDNEDQPEAAADI